MKRRFLQFLSFLGLILTILPSFMVFYGNITLETSKDLMVAGVLIWFFTAPLWLNKTLKNKI